MELKYQTETRDREQIAADAQAIVSRPTRYTTPVQDVSLTSPGQVSLPTRIRTSPTVKQPTLGSVNENEIRETTRKRMQFSIDAINANYANLISREKVQGEDRTGQTRAINARSGLIGSDFGTANQEKTTQFNKQQQQSLVDQQNMQIASVMERIEERASTEIQKRKDEALGKYQMDIQQFEKAQEQARGDLKVLAESGMDLAQLNPAQRAALLKQSGYDEQFGELIYNAMKPKPKQIDYKFEKLADGRGMFYGVDPNTGELKRIDVSVDLPPDWQMTIAPDGTVLGFDKNTGETRMLSDQGQFSDPLDSEYKKAQIEKIYSDIASGGEDKPLSIEEAKALGVPIGTTKSQVAGIVPGQEEDFKATQKALDEAKNTQDLIAELMNHPGRKDATGAMRWLTALPGNAKDFTAKFDQLIAQLQLQNISKLRGTGPITEREQEVLRKAATSLRRDIGEVAFLNELQRLHQSTGGIVQELEQQRTKYQSNSLFDEFEGGGSEGTNPKAQTFSPTISKTLASTLSAKFPDGSIGGQCGDFVRKVANSFGIDYPRLGNSFAEKINAVKKYGTSVANAKIGSVIVTKENPTYGHVAWIIGQNANGYVVAESNFKQSNRVSYGRTIPFNSSKIVGVINPTA